MFATARLLRLDACHALRGQASHLLFPVQAGVATDNRPAAPPCLPAPPSAVSRTPSPPEPVVRAGPSLAPLPNPRAPWLCGEQAASVAPCGYLALPLHMRWPAVPADGTIWPVLAANTDPVYWHGQDANACSFNMFSGTAAEQSACMDATGQSLEQHGDVAYQAAEQQRTASHNVQQGFASAVCHRLPTGIVADTQGLRQQTESGAVPADFPSSQRAAPRRRGGARRQRRQQTHGLQPVLSAEAAAELGISKEAACATKYDTLSAKPCETSAAQEAEGVPLDAECEEVSREDNPVAGSIYENVWFKLSEGGEIEQQEALTEVAGSLWLMAKARSGCRVVQKAFEIADTVQKIKLAEELQGHVLEASRCPHANYVLQKCIEGLPSERIQFIVAELKGNAVSTARHRFGCRVLQRLLEHCQGDQASMLVDEILEETVKLSRHPFGNFAVQHILEHGSPEQRKKVIDELSPQLLSLAKHRLASHVVQCALVHSEADDKTKLASALSADMGSMRRLAHSQYGSFVVREMQTRC